MGKPGSRFSKICCLRIWDGHTTELMSQGMFSDLVLQNKQKLWLGLLLWHYRWKLSLPRFMCWLLQAPLYISVTVRFPVVVPCRFPCNPCGVGIRVVASAIHNTRGTGCPLWDLLSHWRNWRLRGRLFSWFCTGLGEGQGRKDVSASLTF